MKHVDIIPPNASEPMWTLIVRTCAGRKWTMLDITLRGVIQLFRQVRRAKSWDEPPLRVEDRREDFDVVGARRQPYTHCPECGEAIETHGEACYSGFGDPADGPSEAEILGDVGDRD